MSWIAEFARSVDDFAVLNIAANEARLLLTADHDFGDHIFRQKSNPTGVLLIRLAGMPDIEKSERVLRAFCSHGTEMQGKFSVMSARKIRIRDL